MIPLTDPIDKLIAEAWMKGSWSNPFPEASKRKVGEPYISNLQKHLGIEVRKYIAAHGGLKHPPKEEGRAA